MAGYLDKLYKYAPVLVQHMMVSAYGYYWRRLRFGGKFQQEYQAFCDRERFSAEEWQQYTQNQLRALLVSAFTQAPYYTQAWKGLVTVQQLEKFTLADLPSLPPVEKSAIRDNPRDFLIGGQPQKKHLVFHTSGSTGTPVATYWLPSELQRSLAMREARSCKFAGVSFKVPRATFSGRIVEPNPESRGPFYRYNTAENQVYFSAFHLRPDTVKIYLHALKRHNIVWFTGYSNSIYQLAQMALDQGLEIPKLKAVITTSEKVTAEMRDVIERAFSTQVYEEYGTVEDSSYVCENEFGQKLISPDAGVLEIVDETFQPVPVDQQGEVLVTGFIRRNQPLIRYRLGDVATMSSETPHCGRNMPVLQEVIGRIEDTIIGPDGRRMVRFHGIFVDQPHVREGQIIQEQIDHIRVRVVPKAGFSEADEQDIMNRIQQRLTTDMRVTVERVEHIERTASGKFQAVISRLQSTYH
ncbi:MAG: phenylacetate--CoA ligase family protein [Anaerolineales bacterium]|nr:phenylacetate--CoA ligase family protein [Anaerolineales bacterium]